MGFWGPWRHSIGSIHLINRAVTAIKIAENVIGFGKLTAGLQGSLSGGIGLEYGKTGTLTNYTWSDRETIAVDIPYNIKYGVAYLPDVRALANAKEIEVGTHYLYKIGTSGNVIGSVLHKGNSLVGDICLATDKNRYWITDSIKNYIHEVGTRTGVTIGSFASPATVPRGIAYASDKHNIWVACAGNKYIYEIGTRLHNAIGSFKVNVGDISGLALSPDKKRLWFLDHNRGYITEIGTTNKNLIGSIKAPPVNNMMEITFSTDKNRLWLELDAAPAGYGTFYELGTAQGRAYPGTYVKFAAPYLSPPTVIIGKVDNIDNSKGGVFTMPPNLGSFWMKAGSYPAKAAWIALGA